MSEEVEKIMTDGNRWVTKVGLSCEVSVSSLIVILGWGWDSMVQYFRKHQTLDIDGKESVDKQFMPFAARDKYHGTDGPIHTAFNDYYEVSTPLLHHQHQSDA